MHQQVELVGAMQLHPIRSDLRRANAKDLIQYGRILIRKASLSLVSFRHCRFWSLGWIISYINIYHLFEGQHYIIRFLSSSCQLGSSSLEVKYDRFRNRNEGTWQKPLIILTTKDRWTENLTYVTDVQPEETNRWKSINTHTHTYTVYPSSFSFHLQS